MLDFLFVVTYGDGTVYRQNERDVSERDPTRSCFYDVDLDRVEFFELRGRGHRYAVNMVDGHFEVDGVPFRMHEEGLRGYRLIFFRRHTRRFNARLEKLDHRVVYRLGWQANDDAGGNVQRVMEIA